jgi:hypothetical protein
MFRARHTEDGMIHRNQEICRLSFELSGEWRLADVLDDVVSDETPKLSWRDPDASFITDDFCRMFARHTNTSKNFAQKWESPTWSVFVSPELAQYTEILPDYKIILGYADYGGSR